jgi:hypothetical protein
MHAESRIKYSVIHIFHDFSVRDITRIDRTPLLFTGTGTAEFVGFRVHGTRCQHNYMADSLAGGALLCNYYILQISADTSIHRYHDPSTETREDSRGRQFAGF